MFVTHSAIRNVIGMDHVRGDASAAVTLLQYGDYLAEPSRDLASVIDALLRRWDGHLRFVYRHFPAGGVGGMAWRAAEAAEAAGAQGRFWEMHDFLVRHPGQLTEAHLTRCASRAGLEVRRFSRELADAVHAPAVRAQHRGGSRGGVGRAPTLFLNAWPHHTHTLESLSTAVARTLIRG